MWDVRLIVIKDDTKDAFWAVMVNEIIHKALACNRLLTGSCTIIINIY